MATINPANDPGYKYSVARFTGDGGKTDWDFNFAGGYVRRDHIKAYTVINGVFTPLTYTWVGDNTVRIAPAVPLGVTLVIRRETPKDTPLVDFTDGAIINESNLDTNAEQAVFATAEMVDAFTEVVEAYGNMEVALENAEQAALAAALAASEALEAVEDVQEQIASAPNLVATKADRGGGNIYPAEFRASLMLSAAATLPVGTSAGSVMAGDDPRVLGLLSSARSGSREWYVRKDGNDSNDGLANTAGRAFLTIQRAILAAYLADLKGNPAQIFVGDGTYAEGINIYGPLVGGFDDGEQILRIVGNEANPGNVVIQPTNKDAVRIGAHASVILAGFTIGTLISGTGLLVSNHAHVFHRNLVFAACATETIAAYGHSRVIAIGNTTVTGGSGAFVHVTNRAIVGFGGRTLTFVNNPIFSTYVWGVNDASVYLDSATIVGKAGGGITVHINGMLNVSSCVGKWTGDQNMRVTSGGLIVAEDKTALKTFYVRPDGSNQNSGFDNTPDGAFYSIGAALNRLRVMPYDLTGMENDGSGSYDWRIVVSAGNFAETVELPDTRFPRVTIEGVGPTTIARSYVTRAMRTAWTIRNQTLGGAGVTCLTALEGAQLNFADISFVESGYIGICDVNAKMSSLARPFSISGSLSAGFLTRFGGRVQLNGSAVTITGNPSIGRFAMAQTNSSIYAQGMTFTGTATGNRYDATSNGVIDTNSGGANYFPGSSPGAQSNGGLYV